MEDSTPFWRQLMVMSGPLFSSIGCGCALSFSTTLLPLLMDPSSDILITSDMASWIGSFIIIGSLTGTVTGPLIMDKLGRKKALFISTIPLLVGWYSIALAHNTTVLLLAKFLQGFGVGVSYVTWPAFIGEITTPKYRGAYNSLVSFGAQLGILAGHFIGSLFSWRIAAVICSAFHILTFFICPFLCETPTWLIRQDRFDESEKVFNWLRGKGESALKEFRIMVLAQKMTSINKISSSDRKSGKKILGYLNHDAFYKPLMISVMLCFSYHGAGFDIILNVYCIIILKQLIDTADTNIDHKTIMLSFDIIKLIASVLAIFAVRAFNRRFCLIMNMFASKLLVSLFILSYLKSLHVTIFYINWIFISLLCLLSFVSYIGIMSFTIPIVGEIFPIAYKSVGISLTGLISSCILFTNLKIAPDMFIVLGLHGTFLVYALINTFSTLYLYFYLPETKGKTLREIEEYFTGEVISDSHLTSEMELMAEKNNDMRNS